MGNVAICLIDSSISASSYVHQKKRLRAERRRIQSLIPRYLSRLYQCDPTITSLHLNDLRVDCKILQALSKPLLNGDNTVTELYLEHNYIGAEGATVIARILNLNSHLKIVSLAHNDIGSVGAMAIASALENNTTLERLNLSYCNIDDCGIQHLAKSLKSNNTLKYLNLEGNYISSNGVHSLLQCVYDTSGGMRSLWESNHSLRAFYGQRSIYSATFPDTEMNRRLVKQLGEILATCNRRSGMMIGGTAAEAVANRGDDRSSSSTAVAIRRSQPVVYGGSYTSSMMNGGSPQDSPPRSDGFHNPISGSSRQLSLPTSSRLSSPLPFPRVTPVNPTYSPFSFAPASSSHHGSSATATDMSSPPTTEKTVAGRKIFRHYLKTKQQNAPNHDALRSEYLECIQNMEMKLVPYVMGWLGRYGNLGVIHAVLEDMPWLLERMGTMDDRGTRPPGRERSGRSSRRNKRRDGKETLLAKEKVRAIVDIVVEEEKRKFNNSFSSMSSFEEIEGVDSRDIVDCQ